MRYLPLILWVLLLPLYLWLWNPENQTSGTTQKSPSAEELQSDTSEVVIRKVIDSKDEVAVAEESTAAATRAEATNEVTVVETFDIGFFYFPYNSDKAEYAAQSEDYLRRVSTLAKDSGKKIILTGHTDNWGAPESNMELGKARAIEIRNKLVSLGTPADRIEARTLGQSKPIATNDNAAGRQQNRRVELVIQ